MQTQPSELARKYSRIESGPHSKNQYLHLFLQAHVGIGILKGEDMVIELANEPILNIWGKSESVIGMTILEALPELIGTGYPALLQHVYQHGITHNAYEDSAILVRNGIPEQVYFNFVYQPWLDADNKIVGVMIIANEVTEQVLSRKKTEESEKRFRDLVMEADVATAIYTGPDMVIQMANEAMCRLWGKSKEVIGKNIMEAVPELEDQPFLSLLRKVYYTGETYKATEDRADLVVNGVLSSFYFNFSYKALRDSDGRIYGILNMATDVTELVLAKRKLAESGEELKMAVEERTRELKQSNENLIHSNHELERFAHVASHDMKEPIRKITVFIRMLEDALHDSLNERNQSLIAKVRKASLRLNHIVDSVLEYSKVNATNEHYELVDLDELISNIESDLEMGISDQRATIIRSPLPDVQGQRFLLFQLFYNLVNNALKFTRKGIDPVIEIAATSDREIEGKLFTGITIKDNGIGFDNEHTQHIFNKFTRLHPKDLYEGTGLGLSLCKTIAERHGGFIEAQGKENEGAQFTVFLPRH